MNIETLFADLSANSNVTISIDVGNEAWTFGNVALQVGGDGRVMATLRFAGVAPRQFTANLDPIRVDSVGAYLLAHHFTTIRAPIKRRPKGDSVVRFRVYGDGATLMFESELWESDRRESVDLDAILNYYEALVAEISGGVLPYGQADP